MENEYDVFAGIDWAIDSHQVCALRATREVIAERSVHHTGSGVNEFLDWLARLSGGHPDRVAVAIEVPRGALVESLVERGFHVFAINPKQLDRFRDRHTVAGAKDDRKDAFVLADSVRTDRPCFRRVDMDDPLIIQLREASRAEDDLREELNRLTNRVREQVHRYYPQLLRLCTAADEPWFWSLLQIAPTPAVGAKLPPKRVEALLRKHRIRRIKSEDVIPTLRELALFVAPGTAEAASAHIALLIPRLRLAFDQRAQCARRVEKLLEQLDTKETDPGQQNEHRDVQILRSLPGVGRIVAATMLAEASQPLAERDYRALRTLAGTAPITRRSGKRSLVIMRHACNARLRNALYHWARVAAQHDLRARQLYAGLRARGHTHGRALRQLADRLLSVLVAMLRTNTLYDPKRATRVTTGSSTKAIA
jgi:transposase